MRDEIEVLLIRRAEFLKEKILKPVCKKGVKGPFAFHGSMYQEENQK